MYVADGDTPCKANDPELWFRKWGQKDARQHCMSCLERTACLASALSYEGRMGTTVLGMYGGLSEDERAQIHKRKRQGKRKPAA